jgi:hypothetical protein
MDNEKLKQMAEQCITEDQFAVGAFAKLLIDECILALDSAEKPHVYTSFDQAQFDSSIANAKLAIKKHFGLE